MRKALLLGLLLGTAAAPASSEPVVTKAMTGWVDVWYVPGTGLHASPGGDLAAGFGCRSEPGESDLLVWCDKHPDGAFTYLCSSTDIEATGPSVSGTRVRASGYCADSSGGWIANLDTKYESRKHIDHPRLDAVSTLCHVELVETALAAPFHVRCTFLSGVRQPILGGVTMSQALPGGPVQVTLSGVLATSDWTCALTIGNPPTVRCTDDGTDPALTQWYCSRAIVTATVHDPVPPLVPRVRGQLSCDDTRTPIAASSVSGGTISTAEVPTAGGATTDANTVTFDLDTHVFVCQAWGPLNTVDPVAPWTVSCDEP